MSSFAPSVCRCPKRPEEGVRSPGSGRRGSSALPDAAVRTESGCSTQAARALHREVTSPAPWESASVFRGQWHKTEEHAHTVHF